MKKHCCLSLSKCVNDKVDYEHRRLRRKSKMKTFIKLSDPKPSFIVDLRHKFTVRNMNEMPVFVQSSELSNRT